MVDLRNCEWEEERKGFHKKKKKIREKKKGETGVWYYEEGKRKSAEVEDRIKKKGTCRKKLSR